MTTTIRLQTSQVNASEPHRTDTAEALLTLFAIEVHDANSATNKRIERLNHLRDMIAGGVYYIRAADLAEKLLSSLREGSGLRSPGVQTEFRPMGPTS